MRTFNSLIAIALFLFIQTAAQTIPQERLTDWSKAGLIDFKRLKKSVSISDFGADANGKLSCNNALNAAFINLGPSGGIILFESGTYFFDQQINVPSNIILKGKGSQKTTLIFNLKGKGHCISFSGKINNKATAVLSTDLAVGNSSIVAASKNFEPGSYIFIRHKNFTKLNNQWAMNHFGQIVAISDVVGNSIKLKEPLRHPISGNTDIRVLNPIKNSGIEGVKIIRQDGTKDKTANISFKYAVNCFVNGVESEKANYAHVLGSHSAYLWINGSYFHHAFGYGSGGKGYGVLLHFSTSSCLVENNVFEHLRHSMILQAGANGNVFAYNYSTDPFWEQSFFPSKTAGDIVMHGNWPYYNLFEGNIAQNLVVDGSHGRNGPNNTFFRNRLEYLGITCVGQKLTDHQNFIANEVTSTSFLTGIFVVLGSDHLSQYNIVRGEIQGMDTEPSEISLFRKTAPSYLTASYKWPMAGTKLLYNNSDLPAKTRFEDKTFTQVNPLFQAAEKKKKGFWHRLFRRKN